MNTQHLCPCGTKKPYKGCCGQYISGQALPNTPEELMRSRYTAYTQANMDYIQDTMRDNALEKFNRERSQDWATKNTWVRLNVRKTFFHDTDENIGYVIFSAYYWSENGYAKKLQELNETSEFKRLNGRWFYVDRI